MKIEIDGVGVIEVGDDFKNMTKRQQQDFVNNIARDRKSVESKNNRQEDDGYNVSGLLRTLGQGAGLGFGDEIEAGLRTGFGLLGDYDKTVGDVRADIKDFARENPMTALAAEIGGGLVTGGIGGARAAGSALGRKAIAKFGAPAFAGGVGATEGAIAGVGAGEDTASRISGGLVGGTLGGAGGAALPAAIGGGKALVNRVRSGVSDKAAQNTADLKTIQAFEEAGVTPQQVKADLDEANQAVGGALIPDVGGEATRRLARGAATVSGEGADIATKALDERAAGLGDQIADDVGTVLAGGRSADDALDEILDRQTREASGDFDKAFFRKSEDGEIVVPNQMAIEDLSEIVDTEAFKLAYNKARRIASNTNSTLPSLKALQESVRRSPKSVMDEFGEYTQKSKVFEEGQQGDIQRAIQDSTYRKELVKANPKYEKAIDLMEEYQSKINDGRIELTQQQGHFIKMGMDAAIDSGRRSGSLSNVEQGQTKQIRTKLKDILNQNGDYALATEKFAGDMALRDAIDVGKKFTTGDLGQIRKKVAEMSPSEKEAFRIGVAQSIRDTANNTADMADVGRKIFNTPKKREALKIAFPDDASFEAFEKRMTMRANQVVTRNKTSPSIGSQTELRRQEVGNLNETADAVSSMLMGNPLPAARSLTDRVTNRLSTSGKVGGSVARNLFEADPIAQREFLDRLIDRQAKERARMSRAGRNAGLYGGTVGTLSGLLTGER